MTINFNKGPSWLYGSWIYNYMCNHCLSPLKLWVRIPLWRCVLDTTLCDKVCQWLATGQWLSQGTPISSTVCHDITEILLNVVLKHNNLNEPLPIILTQIWRLHMDDDLPLQIIPFFFTYLNWTGLTYSLRNLFSISFLVCIFTSSLSLVSAWVIWNSGILNLK